MPGAWARPEISIPDSVEISQRKTLRLGDIALVKNSSPELLTFIDTIVLREDARDLLLRETLNSSEILNRVRQGLSEHAALKKLNPAFKIPTQVKVSFSTTSISKKEVERRILNTLKVRCGDCEYTVSVQSTPQTKSEHWNMDLSQLSSRGGFLLPVRDGEQGQIKWISGTIRVSQLTPVATRLILQGERVQPADVRLEMTDTTFAKDNALRLEDIQGQLAARALSVGTAIWSSDLKREPAARRGQIVKALLGDADFEISVNMLADENGFIGDMIRVKNPENQKILSGVVIEKGVVKLQ